MILWACSSFDGRPPEAIAFNTAYAFAHAGVVALLALVALSMWAAHIRCRFYPGLCGFLLLLHPAWTISALNGDCGHLKAAAAEWFGWIATLAVVGQLVHTAYRAA